MIESWLHDELIVALSTVGDFAEIFVEENRKNGIATKNGIIDTAFSRVDYSVGMWIVTGFNAIYTYTNDLTQDSLIAMTKEAAAAVSKNSSSRVFAKVFKS